MTVLLLILGALLVGWWLRSEKAAIDENAAFHRGYAAGRLERTSFRSIEALEVERFLESL